MIPQRAMRIRANAKVNLFLRVLGARPDGYHDIETVFHGIDLADDLEVVATGTDGVVVEMSFADGIGGRVPTMESNLAYIAARLLAARRTAPGGAEITITKRIPMGAGLGGGSSDAAAVLVALNELWDVGLDRSGLRAIAADVGSDVPYLVDGGTVVATGRGEILKSIPAAELWLVLGISMTPLATADVYARWSPEMSAGEDDPAEIIEAVRAGDAARVGSLLHNDLEGASLALRPELDGARAALLDAGALGARVSGSGPTVFGVAHNESHANAVAGALAGRFDAVRVARTAPRAIEVLERVRRADH